jgi:hypothetical protein
VLRYVCNEIGTAAYIPGPEGALNSSPQSQKFDIGKMIQVKFGAVVSRRCNSGKNHNSGVPGQFHCLSGFVNSNPLVALSKFVRDTVVEELTAGVGPKRKGHMDGIRREFTWGPSAKAFLG